MEKEKILQIIRELSEKKGSAITRREFPHSFEVYTKHFKTWNEALESAGYPSRIQKRFSDNSEEAIINSFKNEYLKLSPKGYKDYAKRRSETAPSPTHLKRKTGKNWNDLIKFLGLPVYKEHFFDVNNAYIFLKEYMDLYNEVPSIEKFQKFLKETNKRLSVATFKAKGLGSWNEFLKSCGLEIFKTPKKIIDSKEEIRKKYIEFSEKIGEINGATYEQLKQSEIQSSAIKLRFNSLNILRKECGYISKNGRELKYTKEELKEILKLKYKEYGRRLKQEEIRHDADIPSVTIFCSYFRTTKMSEVWDEIERELKK